MKPNALAVALISTAASLPAPVHAADDVCSRLIIYAITQFCQLLPNGQNLCQPIGLAKPDPTCNSPSTEQVVQIPLGPPTIQAWPYAQFTSAPNAFVPNAFAPNTLIPNTFAPNAFTPNTLFPPSIPNQFNGNPYLTYLYGQSANGSSALPASPTISAITTKVPDNEPTKIPDAPVQAPVIAAIKPEPIIEAAPIPTIPPVTQPIDTLMSEAKPDARPEIIVEPRPDTGPTVSAETSSPPTEQAVSPVVSPDLAETSSTTVAETSVTPVAKVVSTAIAAQPEATAVQIPPMVEIKPVEQPVTQVTTAATPVATIEATPATPLNPAIATTPAIPIEPDAAKQAELAQVELAQAEAEKERQDALAHFEFDSAELTPLGRSMLDNWIKQASTNEPILVTGHADRLGPEPYNEKLSLLRAEAVKKYLIEKGKPAKRIEIQAKGEKLPLINCTGTPTDATIACLAPNRRAEIVFKPIIRKSARTATKPYKHKASQ